MVEEGYVDASRGPHKTFCHNVSLLTRRVCTTLVDPKGFAPLLASLGQEPWHSSSWKILCMVCVAASHPFSFPAKSWKVPTASRTSVPMICKMALPLHDVISLLHQLNETQAVLLVDALNFLNRKSVLRKYL